MRQGKIHVKLRTDVWRTSLDLFALQALLVGPTSGSYLVERVGVPWASAILGLVLCGVITASILVLLILDQACCFCLV